MIVKEQYSILIEAMFDFSGDSFPHFTASHDFILIDVLYNKTESKMQYMYYMSIKISLWIMQYIVHVLMPQSHPVHDQSAIGGVNDYSATDRLFFLVLHLPATFCNLQ